MQTILTVFFSMLAGGGVFWCVLELRERQASRRILRYAANEEAAQEGMRRLRRLDAGEVLDSATVYDPPRARPG